MVYRESPRFDGETNSIRPNSINSEGRTTVQSKETLGGKGRLLRGAPHAYLHAHHWSHGKDVLL